jgi:serine/threonine protein kinase
MAESQSLLGQTVSHYTIIKKLGCGGMGEVYLAEDTRLGRKVAVKFLPAETAADEGARQRLLREARTAATLDHTNICAIYEVGEEGGQSFIVLQYIEGETLAARLKRQPPDIPELHVIAAQVAEALAEAHARGIIHGDIKPENIMLTTRTQVKVLDFGLAKVLGAPSVAGEETMSMFSTPGMLMGTVPYMSPEQVRGEVLDCRSDIFSFGTVLYEMLSGQRPFRAQSTAEIMSAILTAEPPPISRFGFGQVGSGEERLIRKCLKKDAALRYQVMGDLISDLQQIRGDSENGPATQAAESLTVDVIRAEAASKEAPRIKTRAGPGRPGAGGGGGAVRLDFSEQKALVCARSQIRAVRQIRSLPRRHARNGQCEQRESGRQSGCHQAIRAGHYRRPKLRAGICGVIARLHHQSALRRVCYGEEADIRGR